MPKRHPPKRTSTPQKVRPTAPEVATESQPIVKRHIWESTKYLAKSGVDTAIQHVWGIILVSAGGGMLTTIS